MFCCPKSRISSNFMVKPCKTSVFFHRFAHGFHGARGMETLTSQYLALAKYPEGIVDVKCDPCKVCASAAKQVTTLAPTKHQGPI